MKFRVIGLAICAVAGIYAINQASRTTTTGICLSADLERCERLPQGQLRLCGTGPTTHRDLPDYLMEPTNPLIAFLTDDSRQIDAQQGSGAIASHFERYRQFWGQRSQCLPRIPCRDTNCRSCHGHRQHRRRRRIDFPALWQIEGDA